MKSLIVRIKPVYLLILIGSLVWSITMVKSGLVYSYGMGFWGPNGHDGVWHIALSGSLARDGWDMPVMAGETIKNYHLGFDLLLAMFHKLTFIPLTNLYFQVTPVLLALFVGIFVYKFVKQWTKSDKAAFWSTFFVYFSGSYGWVITLLRDRSLSGESMFWSQQSVSTLINPPFALSLVIIFSGLWLLIKYLGSGNNKLRIPIALLFGILVQIKVYSGILVIASLFAASIWYLIVRGSSKLLRIFIVVFVLSAILVLPEVDWNAKTIIWKPFWFLETMMSDPSRLYWEKYAQAMINYKLGGVYLKEIMAYGGALAIFIIGNLGIRVLSFLYYTKRGLKFGNYDYIDVFVTGLIILGIVIPMLFVQNGTLWNTIQFFYYSLVFLAILSGIVLSDILKRISPLIIKFLIVLFIILLTYPTLVATLRNYLPSRPPAMISKEELSALRYLAGQPAGIVLTQPYDRESSTLAIDNPPRPLYLYESTAYVSALSNKPTYLEDEMNLDITGYDWKKRIEELKNVINENNPTLLIKFLEKYNISYIYNIKNYRNFSLVEPFLNNIYENDKVIIYKVN